MADEKQQEQQHDEQSGAEQGGGGTSTAVKAAAAAAATGVAAIAARKALSNRGGEGSNVRSSSNGGSPSSRKGDLSSTLNHVLSGGWEAARDALVPAAEDAAGAAGEWVAQNGPEVVRERIVPKFIDSFNDARGES
jgi:hypothetical protein